MILGITMDDDKGLEGDVSLHFGQCRYFFIADIKDNNIVDSKVIQNNATHGGGGCIAVDEILKHKVTHVIAGGMGMGAQNKFAQAGVAVFGYSGKVKDAVESLLRNTLGGLGSCKEHGDCH
jgi:predicted Fe-Mo cluster-binding NifX family protein